MASITIRPPTFSKARQAEMWKNPTISWLTEEWHVTHSSLPMWKSKRNVRIRYTPLEPSDPAISKDDTDRVDDLVSYQTLSSSKVQTIEGIDRASSGSRGEWDWRGKGWLKIASSHWEVLGWGEEEGSGNKWVVTCFAKTLFTPAGIDVYSQSKNGVRGETLDMIKTGLAEVDDMDVKKMSEQIFAIKTEYDATQ